MHHRDFRDVDRERQRLAREGVGGVGGRGRERERAGHGMASKEELLTYVKGEVLTAHSLALPGIDGDLDGLELVRRVDVRNNSLQSLGGLRRLEVVWLKASCNRLAPSLIVVHI